MYLYYVTSSELSSVSTAIYNKLAVSVSNYPTDYIDAFSSVFDTTVSTIRGYLNRTTARSEFISSYFDKIKIVRPMMLGINYTLDVLSLPLCEEVCDYGFSSAKSVGTYLLPNCKKLGKRAFYNTNVTSISLPLCEEVGESAFNLTYNLTYLNLPLCSFIPSGCFFQCTGLQTAIFPRCEYVGSTAFMSCSNLLSVSLPVCSLVSDYAFSSCNSLSTISLPACTIISTGAFIRCSALMSVYLLGSSYCSLAGLTVFQYTPLSLSSLTGTFGSIFVPSSMLATYKTMGYWSYYSSRFVGV